MNFPPGRAAAPGREVRREGANPGAERVREGENVRENMYRTTWLSLLLIMLAFNSLDLEIKLF